MKIKMNNAVGPQVRGAKPKPSKLLPALGALSLGGGLQAATQFFAHTFNYQATLGGHIGHVYAPWSILAVVVDVVQPAIRTKS
jgi:type IV secretion system protein VirD4